MKVCIIGTGYVGLVTAACFAEMGNTVICVDVNPEIVKKLNLGIVHIWEPGLEQMVQRNSAEGCLRFTINLPKAIQDADVAFICVGTPPDEDGSCDVSYVCKVAQEIGACLVKDMIVVNKSTVPVGTADIVKKIIEDELKKRDVNYKVVVVSNPEFLKEGNAINDFMKPDRVVIGTNSEEAAQIMRELYAPYAHTRDKIIVMDIRSAEMTKYAANCMLATKISFINEIAKICELVGADVRDVRNGIGSDTRIGYQFIYPGVGYGGSCFPKDVKALIATAKNSGMDPSLLIAVENVNALQKLHLARRMEKYFDGNLAGKIIAVWGLSFKANTDDMREAASISLINELTRMGARIRAHDPVALDNAKRVFASNRAVEFFEDQYEACKNADALLVVTEWNQFRNPNFEKIKTLLNKPVIFDGRNLYSPEGMKKRGYTYICIGR